MQNALNFALNPDSVFSVHPTLAFFAEFTMLARAADFGSGANPANPAGRDHSLNTFTPINTLIVMGLCTPKGVL